MPILRTKEGKEVEGGTIGTGTADLNVPSGWRTVFVFGQSEMRFDRLLPALSEGSLVTLRFTDKVDNKTVVKAYKITRVFLDIYAPEPSQLVHLEDYDDAEGRRGN